MQGDRFCPDRDLVSIVTPVYNGEYYIGRLLESVLKQTWDRVEMLVCNDGSKDRTVEVVSSFQRRFEERGYTLRLLSGEHRGAAAAMNLGLPLVTGEYLVWPDGDDFLEPESIERRVLFLKENPQFFCVRSTSRYVDFCTNEEVKREEQLGSLATGRIFWDILFGKTFVCCGCYMLKTRAFFEIYRDRKIPEYSVGQNFQMLLPFMYHFDCPTLEAPLYVVRRRADSHSARVLTEKEEREKYAQYEQMLEELTELIGITKKTELRRVQAWKLNRRLYLAVKYHDRALYLSTCGKQLLNGDIGLLRCLYRIGRCFIKGFGGCLKK